VDAIARNTNGKVLRRVLAQQVQYQDSRDSDEVGHQEGLITDEADLKRGVSGAAENRLAAEDTSASAQRCRGRM
jgi:DNA-binding transcriptional regulator YdaS (Cro superfamily)